MSESITKIIIAAQKLFMRFGIKSVSMDDIARELGVSKKTVYKYFSSKKELVKQILLHQFDEENRVLEGIKAKRVNAIEEMLMITAYVKEVLSQYKPTIIYDLRKYHKEAWNVMEEMHKKCVFGAIRENIVQGKKEGLYRSELNPEMIAQIYTTVTLSMFSESGITHYTESLVPIYKTYIDYHLHALMTPKGLKIHEKHLTHA